MTRHLTRSGTLSAAAILLGSTALSAQEIELPDITVFAYQTEVDYERAGVSVEVIGEDEARGQPLRFADRLEQEPGVTVAGNGGVGGVTYIRIRGLDQRYIPVLIDGIDITDPAATQTSLDWGNLSGATLGRTEILKGASSAIYGANAVGGVVNIQSPRPTEMGTRVTTMAEFGSYDTVRAAIGVQTRGERGWLSFGAVRTRTDGFSMSAEPGNDEADGYSATQMNLAGEVEVAEGLRIGGALYWLDAENDCDTFVEPPAGSFNYIVADGTPDEVATTEALGARVYAEYQTGAVTHTLAFSGYDSDRTSSSDGFTQVFDGTRRKLEYKADWRASDALRVTAGADAERETLASGGTTYEVDTTGVFAEALYAPNARTDLAVSLRHDDHETFGGQTSGRVALSYRPNDDLILRAAVSTGFRAPSLYELYGFYGNAGLRPEQSVSAELGVEQRLAGGVVRATLFQNRVEDLIDYDFATNAYGQIAGETRIRGLEVSGEMAVSDTLTLFGSYTLTDTETASGGRLLRVPRHDLVLGVDAALGYGLSGNLTVQRIADRPDEFGTVMEDYTLVGMGVTYAISDRAEAYLRVENLTDETYEQAAGYATSGRAAFFGVRASF